MMFAYSFLAMTAYNILKPITRSQFITALGADTLPYVQLAAGLFAHGLDAVRYTLQHGDARARAAAIEYVDNVLTGAVRRRVVPILESHNAGRLPAFARSASAGPP
jgi:hypothetical protein